MAALLFVGLEDRCYHAMIDAFLAHGCLFVLVAIFSGFPTNGGCRFLLTFGMLVYR